MTLEQKAYEDYNGSLGLPTDWENEPKEVKAAWTVAVQRVQSVCCAQNKPVESEQYQTGRVGLELAYKLYIENGERKIDYIVNGAAIWLEDTELVGMDESLAAANNLAVISDVQTRMQSAVV